MPGRVYHGGARTGVPWWSQDGWCREAMPDQDGPPWVHLPAMPLVPVPPPARAARAAGRIRAWGSIRPPQLVRNEVDLRI